MKEDRDINKDIAEIRSMMERSTKFLSLSGWAGIMAGIYALAGAWIVYTYYDFNPGKIVYSTTQTDNVSSALPAVIGVAVTVLILAIGTAMILSYQKANKRDEKVWNATSRRLLAHMAVPLLTGGILILILLSNGLIGLVAPLTLIFYGLALYNASKFTYVDLKFLGLIQVVLGLFSVNFVAYGLLFWAVGFGVVHIFYGIYIYFKYER